nr:MAG TPA: hypothetical protein [Caudoviricetes sp.]
MFESTVSKILLIFYSNAQRCSLQVSHALKWAVKQKTAQKSGHQSHYIKWQIVSKYEN